MEIVHWLKGNPDRKSQRYGEDNYETRSGGQSFRHLRLTRAHFQVGSSVHSRSWIQITSCSFYCRGPGIWGADWFLIRAAVSALAFCSVYWDRGEKKKGGESVKSGLGNQVLCQAVNRLSQREVVEEGAAWNGPNRSRRSTQPVPNMCQITFMRTNEGVFSAQHSYTVSNAVVGREPLNWYCLFVSHVPRHHFGARGKKTKQADSEQVMKIGRCSRFREDTGGSDGRAVCFVPFPRIFVAQRLIQLLSCCRQCFNIKSC